LTLNIHPLSVRASFTSDQHNLTRPLADYNRAITLAPDALEYNDRGDCYLESGKNDLAMADFNQAISIDATYTLAYLNRGRVYTNLGQYPRRLTILTMRLELDPNNSQVFSVSRLGLQTRVITKRRR